jgi:hypothetical protein
MSEPKKKRGPKGYSREVREELLSNLREPMSIKAACALSGISQATYYNWLEGDPEWAEEVAAAKRFSEPVMVSRLKSLAEEKGDWRGYAWLLERRFPEEWSAKQEIELNQTVNDGGAALVVQMIEQTDQRLLEIRHDQEGESSADAELEYSASTRENDIQGEG